MSNTKLTRDQKTQRKQLRDSWLFKGGALFFFGTLGVTVAIRRTGVNVGEFAASIASTGESVARRKVGEFVALERAEQFGETHPLRLVEKPDESTAHSWGYAGAASAERDMLRSAARHAAQSLAGNDDAPSFIYKGKSD